MFWGIPFAQPPLNTLRWAPARAYTTAYPSAGLRAINPPPECAQPTKSGFAGSEDCLFLNVFTPKNASKNSTLPVRVWIHGGGNTGGYSAERYYNGCATAQATQSIVVTLNYRLGVFGFLVTNDLMRQGFKGNYALTDQRMALSWVQDNIAAFGGNPSTVLLFGESAGGLNTFLNFLSPGASALFSSIMVESAGIREIPTAQFVANTIGEALLTNVGCSSSRSSTISCLQSLNVSTLIGAEPEVSLLYLRASPPVTPIFGPVVDGVLIKDSLTKLLQSGRFPRNLTVGIGANSDEGNIAVYEQYSSTTVSSSALTGFIRQVFPTVFYNQLSKQYNAGKYGSVFAAFGALWTDAFEHCNLRRTLMDMANHTTTASRYVYLFVHTPKCSVFGFPLTVAEIKAIGASHGAEVPFVFQNDVLDTSMPSSSCPCLATSSEQKMAQAMAAQWTSIAAYGTAGPRWLPWNSSTCNVAVWDAIKPLPNMNVIDWSDKCALFDEIHAYVGTITGSSRD